MNSANVTKDRRESSSAALKKVKQICREETYILAQTIYGVYSIKKDVLYIINFALTAEEIWDNELIYILSIENGVERKENMSFCMPKGYSNR